MSNQLLPCPFCQNPAEEVSGCKGWFSCADEECPAWHIQAKADDWNRRATQTAAGEPEPFIVGNQYRTQAGDLVRFVAVHNEGNSYETMEDESGVNRYTRRDFGRCTGTAHDYSDPRNTPPLWTAPPAAAHGDEAVRKDDRAPGLEWAINKCTAMQEHGFDRVRLDLFKRDLEGALAAMRAQGDGGEV